MEEGKAMMARSASSPGGEEVQGWMVKELTELYKLEEEAANCYEKLDEQIALSGALERKVEEVCGAEEVARLTNALALESRRKRLESISGRPVEGSENVSRFFDESGKARDHEEWVNLLPLRFRREVELERARERIEELQGRVDTLKDESSDLSSLIHENANHLKTVEADHEEERDTWKRSERDYESSLRKLKEEKQKIQDVSSDLMEEQEGLRDKASHMQHLMMQQKQESEVMFQQVRTLEEKLVASMHSLQSAENEIEEMKGRETLQSEQLQAVILARNASEEEAGNASKKVRTAELQKRKAEKQVQVLKKRMEQIGKKTEEEKEALHSEIASQACEIEEKANLIKSLEEEKEEGKGSGADAKVLEELEEEIKALKSKESGTMTKLRAAVKKGKAIEQQFQEAQKRLKGYEEKGGAVDDDAAESNAAEQSQMIADLQGKLEEERERANQSEAAGAELKETLSELAALQEQISEMEDENTKLEAASALSLSQRDEAEAKVSSLEQREVDLAQQVESLAAEVENMRSASSSDAEGLRAKVAELEQQLSERANAEADDASEQGQMIADLQGKLEGERERANQSEAAGAELKEKLSELAALQEQISEMEDENTKLEAASALSLSQRDEAEAKVSSLEQREVDLAQQVESLAAEVENMRSASSSDAEGLRAKVAELEQQLSERANAEADDASEQGQMIADLQGKLEEERERANQSEAAGAELKEKLSELAALQEQISEMEDENTKLEAASALSLSQRDEAEAKVSSLEQREVDLAQQVESLAAEVENMRSASSSDAEGLRAKVAELEQQLSERANAEADDASEQGQMIADLQGKLEEERERANQSEAAGAELKEKLVALEMKEQRELIAEDEAVEQQQLIAELESRLHIERERADQNEGARSELEEKAHEIELLQSAVASKDGDISKLQTKVEEAQQNKLNSERMLQSEMEQLMREINVKQEQINDLQANGAKNDSQTSSELRELKQEMGLQKEYISQLETNLHKEKEDNLKAQEMQDEFLKLEEGMKEKLLHTEELETRLGAIQEEFDKAAATLKEKEQQIEELSQQSPPPASAEPGEDYSKLQQKQKDTMHKLKAAVVKGKNIQEKLEAKEKELSLSKHENSKLSMELEEAKKKLLGGVQSAPTISGPPDTAAEAAVILDDSWNSGAEEGWEISEKPARRPSIEEKSQKEGPKDIGSLFDKMAAEAVEDSDEDGEDVQIDEALKTAGANLWNWVSGS
ncbi:hypothetical protein A3770_05p35950 [Chloropicon primus]|uniref:Uncharacterized protein n=3 Tax=Chloropicon primus TaxID=1764295 RepID=A0A5B8MKT8_9CHLO|nr:hypothetical protein A3770_05p35950 [Chloropicon primus]|eukprot:QDZ21077.1 hypothetical protein A3770_05p35950 [Chloropicon primus]